MTRWAEWSEAINAITPARECTADADCVVVSASLECDRDGGRVTHFFRGCDLPANRDAVATFESDRDTLATEFCAGLTCTVSGCNVDGGMPAVRCVGGMCTKP